MARQAAAEEGCGIRVTQESYGDTVVFDPMLRDDLSTVLGGVPALPTGAGHDAGILASRVPTAMLFVRNPTGVSHAPQEYAEPDDCEAGVAALAATLEHLAS
jgi:N-carbamoyl-L-amino-acid hydrolase